MCSAGELVRTLAVGVCGAAVQRTFKAVNLWLCQPVLELALRAWSGLLTVVMVGCLQRIAPRNLKATATYAEAARAVAASFPGKNVHLADAFQTFVSQGDWGTRLMAPDGLHLSRQGNNEAWYIMYNAINDKMQMT